ncbi:MAG: sugar kinase [Acidimicrobiaceae bacterium]|nr:sugar kinase [Acidimicrobiaceae bacterium]
MLVALGDLVDDVVVRLQGPVNPASDTDARITHRRGGSAANVAAIAARTGAARFVGQVGDDPTGTWLASELAACGVDVAFVRRAGRSATIVVLVDESGERTMLVDQGSARQIDRPERAWLHDADVLHLTLYSLLDEPIASTSRALAAMASEAGVAVSVDVSSVALIERVGAGSVVRLLRDVGADVVFANADEARALGGAASKMSDTMLIEKRGPEPARVRRPGFDPIDVPATPITRPADTTGAGDAFAAGFLTSSDWRHDPVAACVAGHTAARTLLLERSSLG